MKMECGKLQVFFMETRLSKSGVHDRKCLMQIDLLTTRCVFLYVIEILIEKLMKVVDCHSSVLRSLSLACCVRGLLN